MAHQRCTTTASQPQAEAIRHSAFLEGNIDTGRDPGLQQPAVNWQFHTQARLALYPMSPMHADTSERSRATKAAAKDIEGFPWQQPVVTEVGPLNDHTYPSTSSTDWMVIDPAAQPEQPGHSEQRGPNAQSVLAPVAYWTTRLQSMSRASSLYNDGSPICIDGQRSRHTLQETDDATLDAHLRSQTAGLMRSIDGLRRSAPSSTRPSLMRSQTMPIGQYPADEGLRRPSATRLRRRPTIAPLAESMSRSCSSQGHSPYPLTPVRRSSSSAKLLTLATMHSFTGSMPPTPVTPDFGTAVPCDQDWPARPDPPLLNKHFTGYDLMALPDQRGRQTPPRTPLHPLQSSIINAQAGQFANAFRTADDDASDGDENEPFVPQFMTATDIYSV